MKSAEVGMYIPEKKQKGQRHWEGKREQQKAVYSTESMGNSYCRKEATD
jgi:hypothetical protein